MERVLLKLPVLPGLTAKAAMLWKLLCPVTLLLGTVLDTPLVVPLMPVGHPHGRLNLVKTVPTLVLPLLVAFRTLIILFNGPPVLLGYLATWMTVPLLSPLFPSPLPGTKTLPVSAPLLATRKVKFSAIRNPFATKCCRSLSTLTILFLGLVFPSPVRSRTPIPLLPSVRVEPCLVIKTGALLLLGTKEPPLPR